jgi:hypothetical protein
MAAVNVIANRISMRELVLATSDHDQCLRANRLLAVNMQCSSCGSVMHQCPYSRSIDGSTWRCPQQGCRKIANLRKGFFFERSYLPLSKLLDLVYWWSLELPNGDTEQQV